MNINKVKICVPIIGRNKEEIINETKKAVKTHADVIEWRVDYYEDAKIVENVITLLKDIHKLLDGKELIFTYRSAAEGGKGNIEPAEYLLLNKTACLTKLVNYIDVELLLGDTLVGNLVKHAKIYGTKVIISNHDFDSTPRKDIIVNRLQVMLDKGADVAKGAFTPKNDEDVKMIMEAGQSFSNEKIILIAMGELGKKTRTQPILSNSCMTFGCIDGQESAPGQIEVEALYQILNEK